MNVLFVCSRNQWRSRTAESIFKNDDRFQVRSAGTARTARIRLSSTLIDWADHILVMEDQHLKFIREQFRDQLPGKQLFNLDIPDDYQYLDGELIEVLQQTVDYLFPR